MASWRVRSGISNRNSGVPTMTIASECDAGSDQDSAHRLQRSLLDPVRDQPPNTISVGRNLTFPVTDRFTAGGLDPHVANDRRILLVLAGRRFHLAGLEHEIVRNDDAHFFELVVPSDSFEKQRHNRLRRGLAADTRLRY